jgi:hypothetical protein
MPLAECREQGKKAWPNMCIVIHWHEDMKKPGIATGLKADQISTYY